MALITRRNVLIYSSGVAAMGWTGCAKSTTGPTTPDASSRPLARPIEDEARHHALATKTCIETHDNIEGPYYRDGAPERWNLVEQRIAGVTLGGTALDIEGRVTGVDCRTPLANAELDVWHATPDGHYDNDGTMHVPASGFLLRGKLRTDEQGRYFVRTVVPGRYLNGSQFRPAHVHVKVRAPGYAALTTQLYFPDDPYNRIDPFIHPSLIMAVDTVKSGASAHFDFALRPA